MASAWVTSDAPEFDDPVFARMVEIINASRPLATFDLSPDRLDGSWILDGSADDGSGPGRLYVAVTPRRGDLTAHPCADPDFRQGGACVERLLADGSRLVLRDRVTSFEVTTVLAVVIHPDRSGVTAEASDLVLDPASGPNPGVDAVRRRTRPGPMYSARELGELVVAIDRAVAARR